MKHLLASALCLILSACVTASGLRDECAAAGNFAAETACFEQAVAQSPALQEDSFVREYVLTGKVLTEKLAAGRINENEARLELARAWNEMKMQRQRFDAWNAVSLDRLRPRHTVCHETGGVTTCDTY